MPSRTWTLRMAALMGAGAFAVHQLRFALSSDHGSAPAGHAYLASVGPILVGLLLLAFAAALGRIARGVVDRAPRFRLLWAGTSGVLLGVYCAQEAIEGLSRGEPAGMFQHGGWVAIPLAAVVGLAIALIMRGAAAAAELAAATRAPWQAASPAPPLVEALLPPWAPRRTQATARHLAARGPPLASV